LVTGIQQGLRTNNIKQDPANLRGELDAARHMISATQELSNTPYGFDWHEPRWHVAMGDLQMAVIKYQEAFEKA